MALFISLEGGEGSGKTTQVERLSDALANLGVPTLKIHEPGYTELGDHIRYLIKSKPWGGVTISPTAELFLFAASRGELVSKMLANKVKDPRLVIIADDTPTRLPRTRVMAGGCLWTKSRRSINWRRADSCLRRRFCSTVRLGGACSAWTCRRI